MKYPPGTLVWVHCEDGAWWPARVMLCSEDIKQFLAENEDSCVELFHHLSELYPVLSTDASVVQPFHAHPLQRSREEQTWMQYGPAQVYVERALRAAREMSSASRVMDTTPTPSRSSGGDGACAFTASELKIARTLLEAAGVDVHSELSRQVHSATRRDDRDGGRQRKRKRASSAEAHSLIVAPHTASAAAVPVRPRTPPPLQPLFASVVAVPVLDTLLDEERTAEGSTPGFEVPVDAEVLDVIRAEVFENPDRFVLSPTLRVIELLGAVSVENCSVCSTLPSPRALREMPSGGFPADRRVLLVPLSEDYSHTNGWMVPTEVDGVTLSMRLFVNEEEVEVPGNWLLTAGKEATAVKTAPVADITAAVMRGGELFSLQVVFSHPLDDVEQWSGFVACVFAEEVPLNVIAKRIVENYRTQSLRPAIDGGIPRRPSGRQAREGLVDVTEGSVRIQCPITTLVMDVPVRSSHCEHLQCVELAAVLMQCTHSNVWNCPLCNAPMKPSDICVNYRLMNWIQDHRRVLGEVEYVVETPPGKSLKIQYRQRETYRHEAVDVDSDD